MEKIRVATMMGGAFSEQQVSLRSGVDVASTLNRDNDTRSVPSIPGMTGASLLAFSTRFAGITFPELVHLIIAEAQEVDRE